MSKKKVALVLIVTLLGSLLLTGCSTGISSKIAKIAFIAPITGSNAAIGLGLRNSAELAVKQANDKGDLPFKVELVVLGLQEKVPSLMAW